ncbi:MAG: precorrin-8X methylmutase [Gloeomargaritaceae cyanobacterium C42_A2020_066]|nr:precorrin-8X methylmutase [Gloeomargaritaceae cyanobacterium C42_A2020_066]
MHPILLESFALIDREVGSHSFSAAEYAIVRRVIHSTADFEFKSLIVFSPGAIDQGIAALRAGRPVVVDVGMVWQGVQGQVTRCLGNPVVNGLTWAEAVSPGQTRSAAGLLAAMMAHPGAVVAIGNAPTALLALCEAWPSLAEPPALVIGAPVGFVGVLEAKAALARLPIPQIRVTGRKGGSPVAAAIVNALVDLAAA